ncbi:MAG: lipid-binding SYLF domain-containing protein [Methylacidiphilales bacterium]|nr:lipid-binding SYLF domain-containing protein [Candidatus Methylacidiphilales bacterium]
MKKIITKFLALGSFALLFAPTVQLRAADMQERIQTAIQILDKKQGSANPIPAELLNHAKGVAIFSVTKGGLGIGGLGGEGIVVLRLKDMISHSWTAPCAFNLAGGSIGAQIGFTESRYIVILNTDDAVRHFTSSEKMTWDGTATGTAGNDTLTEKATTTELQHREIVVYKDSGGIFGGATLGGTSIERKDEINQRAYGEDVLTRNILNGNVHAPKSAGRMFMLLDGKLN